MMWALGITRMMQEVSGRPAVADGVRQEVTLGSGGGLGARPPAGAWAGAACRRRMHDALLRFYSWVATAVGAPRSRRDTKQGTAGGVGDEVTPPAVAGFGSCAQRTRLTTLELLD